MATVVLNAATPRSGMDGRQTRFGGAAAWLARASANLVRSSAAVCGAIMMIGCVVGTAAPAVAETGARIILVQGYQAPDPYRPGDRDDDRYDNRRYDDSRYDERRSRDQGYDDRRSDDRRYEDVYRPPNSDRDPNRADRNRRYDYGYDYDRRRADDDRARYDRGARERYDRDGRDAARYDRGRAYDDDRAGRRYRDDRPTRMPSTDYTYSENEVIDAGHRFFGSVSRGLAKAVQSLFKSSGRPNGYILGEDAGGAFVAGLRYGEGYLHTKFEGRRRIYWQGPSVGYDFGGEGSKVMVLVYNLRHPEDIYRRFGGVEGSAYVVGGVSVQLQKSDDITLAPIRSGVGLRLGANVGYLKYTRRPTWNPF